MLPGPIRVCGCVLLLLLLPAVNGTTVLQFKRRLETCDPNDRPITKGTARVIYAYGEVAADGNEPDYHQERGSKSLQIVGGKVDPPPLPADAQTIGACLCLRAL